MNSKEEHYKLENEKIKKILQISRDLDIPERKIKRFLEKEGALPQKTGAAKNLVDKISFSWIVASVIFIIALIVRIYPVVAEPETFRYGAGIFGDTHLYHRIAYNLYKGHGFSGTDDGRAYGAVRTAARLEYRPAIARAPAYPAFMALVYRLFGSEKYMESIDTWHYNWDKVRIAQCVLDSITCLFVFFIAWNICRKKLLPAAISSLIYCFNPNNIYYTKALLSESLTTFLLTGAVLLCVLALKSHRSYLWLPTGILFALTAMSRPEYLIFPAILALYIIIVNRVILKKALSSVVLLSIGFALIVFPWTMRNWIVFEKPIAVSVGPVGGSLFVGTFETNTNWQGWSAFPDAAFNDPAEKRQANEIYERFNRLMQEGTIDVKEPDDAFFKMALDRIRQNPVQCFKSWIVRIPRLWYIKYINMYGKPEASGGIFVIYFAFALFAILKSEKSQRTLMAPVLLLFIYLTIIFLPLHVESRYSVNLLPSILCLTGIGIYKLLPRLLE